TGRPAPPSFGSISSMTLSARYACVTKDSTIVLRNRSCDFLTLNTASLSDSSHFQMDPIILPVTLGPFDSVVIHVTASSLKDGSFLSGLLLGMSSNGLTARDTIPLRLTISEGGGAIFPLFDITVPSRCFSVDSAFRIGTTPCDSIVLLFASL